MFACCGQNMTMRAMSVNQNMKVVSKKRQQHTTQCKGTAEFGDNFEWVNRQVQLLSCTQSHVTPLGKMLTLIHTGLI